jgi:uncharacterized protein YbjT (DUF2867 family)
MKVLAIGATGNLPVCVNLFFWCHPSLSALTNHAAKLAVQKAIYESGMEFTVLQPAIFMQNLDSSWPHVVKTRRFSLPFSKHVKTPYVDYRDVAEAVALALTSDKLNYGTFELCAPGMVNRIEIAAMMACNACTPITTVTDSLAATRLF